MSEFFKGWRRKAGLVVLLLACALMGAFLRSAAKYDVVWLEMDGTQYRLWSGGSSVAFVWSDVPLGEVVAGWVLSDLSEIVGFDRDPWFGYEVEWRWDGAGFHFGSGLYGGHGGSSVTSYRVPYWSLVLPLTLLSAWLILIKPRKAKGLP